MGLDEVIAGMSEAGEVAYEGFMGLLIIVGVLVAQAAWIFLMPVVLCWGALVALLKAYAAVRARLLIKETDQ